jgi:hypothetical protein
MPGYASSHSEGIGDQPFKGGFGGETQLRLNIAWKKNVAGVEG